MIITKTIQYNDVENTYEGYMSWDSEIPTKKPGILIAPTFKGQSDFENKKAEELAKMGYVGFAIDLYGKGIRAGTPEEAQQLMDTLNNNRPLLLQRMQLALSTLQNHEQVDANRLGAIGFCFGGKCVLDLARSGAAIKGTVTFHGVYDKPDILYHAPISSSILVLHGWEDPLANPDQTVALAKELTERGADWQLHAFGHTGHAFTNPNAKFPEKGMFYQEQSNYRAWKLMSDFLEEKFV